MNAHLSSEQLEHLLNGQAAPEASRHLNDCARCSDELVSLRETFGNFRAATTASAEHHRYLVPAKTSRRVPGMAWALATAALFVSIASPLAVRHYNAERVTRGGIVAGAPAISDEALLDGVQNDLSSSVPEPLLPLADTSTDTTKSTTSTRKNP